MLKSAYHRIASMDDRLGEWETGRLWIRGVTMTNTEYSVHNCGKCHQKHPTMKKYPPVFSFGALEQKPIWVVGINPAEAEYDGSNGSAPYLSRSTDIEERRQSQLRYFDNKPYDFFQQIEKFFGGEVRDKVVDWKAKPWEKVGFVDLVKCVTKDGWSKLKPQDQRTLVDNCKPHLEHQLFEYRPWPKLIVAYGKPVREWFSRFSGQYRSEYEYARVPIQAECAPVVLFIDQRGYKRSEREIVPIRQSIVKAFQLLGSPQL